MSLEQACRSYAAIAWDEGRDLDFKTADEFIAAEFDGDAWEQHIRLAARFHVSREYAYRALESAFREVFFLPF